MDHAGQSISERRQWDDTIKKLIKWNEAINILIVFIKIVIRY